VADASRRRVRKAWFWTILVFLILVAIGQIWNACKSDAGRPAAVGPSALDSIAVSETDLQALGLTAPHSLEQLQVDLGEVFATRSRVTEKVARTKIIEARDYYREYDDPLASHVGIRLVLLVSAKWAAWHMGGVGYDKDGLPFAIQNVYWRMQYENGGYVSWKAFGYVGRIRIAAFIVRKRQAGPTEGDLVRQGVALFNRQVERAPLLADIPGQDELDLSDERARLYLIEAAVVFLLPLIVAMVSFLRDKESRKRLWLWKRRPPVPPDDPEVRVVELRRRAVSGVGAVSWLVVRSAALGVVSGGVYFLTEERNLLIVMGTLAAIVLVMAAVDLVIKMRGPRGESTVFAATGRTFLYGLLGTGASAILYCGGVYLLFVGVSGFVTYHSYLTSIMEFSTWNTLGGLIVLTMVHLPVRLAERLLQPAKKKKMENDRRDEVLLLRSFSDDNLRIRVHRQSRHSLMEQLTLRRKERFEELLAWNLWHFGPVGAVGRPGTMLAPLGAVREYYSNEQWQTEVRARMSHARMIVFVAGRTRGFEWEITEARKADLLHKCLFVIPPVDVVEATRRLRVLGNTLEIGWQHLGAEKASYAAAPIVALYYDKSGTPVLITAPVRDDLAYQTAIRMAAGVLGAERAVPLEVVPA
jgi:hypothetical protein